VSSLDRTKSRAVSSSIDGTRTSVISSKRNSRAKCNASRASSPNYKIRGKSPILRAALGVGWSDVGAAGGLGEGGHAELGRVSAFGDLVHFGKFGPGPCEADFEAFGFSEPAVGLGFSDAIDEVVADLCQAGSGRGIGPQQGAAQAAVLEPPWGSAKVT